MRLIDADALDYELGASDEDIYFHHMLEDAPTIDAIPVEWLRKWPENLCDSAYVRDILRDWQKEKLGIEPKEG